MNSSASPLSPGGQHPVGSHNVLIAFRDGSYLEIIAFYREALDHRWWEPLSQGERLVDFCFQTDDLRGDTKKLQAAGVAINDPVPWSRKRPDGYELKWFLSLATGSHRGVAPFLIEDVTPRSERIPQTFHHRNGVTGIDKVTVAVGELRQIEKWYGSLLGKRGTAVTVADLGAEGLRFEVGPHIFEFFTPRDAASPWSIGSGDSALPPIRPFLKASANSQALRPPPDSRHTPVHQIAYNSS